MPIRKELRTKRLITLPHAVNNMLEQLAYQDSGYIDVMVNISATVADLVKAETSRRKKSKKFPNSA